MFNQSVVHSDPEIMGGPPVFVGTRVPVKSLYKYLEAGDSLDEFLESFPSVSREQAVAALELGREMTEAECNFCSMSASRAPIKRELVGHDVWHVVDMGWSSKRNGELSAAHGR